MAEKKIAPDSELWVKSLTPEQLLFFITVWNDGGMEGISELILFASDAYNEIPPDKRREVGLRAAERFFSEKAYDEFEKFQARFRLVREREEQAHAAGQEVLGGREDGTLIVTPTGEKWRRGQ